MTAPEAARRSRIVHAADRAAYDAAHLLVRECAGELLGCEAQGLALAQLCPTCGSEAHGMPRMIGSPVHVSLSHTRGYVAAIASWSRCGIDVERAGAPVIRRALGDDEARWVAAQRAPGDAFVMRWTRKEALWAHSSASICSTRCARWRARGSATGVAGATARSTGPGACWTSG
jgi:phosphopantetheinyl transferase